MTLSGLDRLDVSGFSAIAGERAGLVTNAASVNSSIRHSILLMAEAGARLERLFAPEHGLWGVEQDMVEVKAGESRGLPVLTLYGASENSLGPASGMLDGLDALVFDLQDVGCRYYTFAGTMALCMKACAGNGVRFLVLDRPNPIGGEAVEGNLVRDGFFSFVGMFPVPARHGLTIGELALLFHGEFGVGARPEVVAMEGWRRSMRFEDTGLPWVMPSPNMPSTQTALVYPGICLVEGTNLSEGRGTTRPFEIFGAPFIDPDRLAAELGAERLPGVAFRPLRFKPMFNKWAGNVCGGVQLHVTDRRSFKPFLTGIAAVAVTRRLYPHEFGWRTEPYEFVSGVPAIDLLFGTDAVRRMIEAGAALSEIEASYAEETELFKRTRGKYLLYS